MVWFHSLCIVRFIGFVGGLTMWDVCGLCNGFFSTQKKVVHTDFWILSFAVGFKCHAINKKQIGRPHTEDTFWNWIFLSTGCPSKFYRYLIKLPRRFPQQFEFWKIQNTDWHSKKSNFLNCKVCVTEIFSTFSIEKIELRSKLTAFLLISKWNAHTLNWNSSASAPEKNS